MDMRVMHERLSPRVQHAQKADLGAQAFGVGRDLQQRVGHTAEQQVVERSLVLQHERGELVRDGEHHVAIVQRNQFANTRRHPTIARLRLALGTVAIAAGVEGEAEILSTSGANVPMTAERGGAAALDGAHDFMLRPRNAGAAALDKAPGPGAEDIGHLQRGSVHHATGSGSGRWAGGSVSSGLGALRNFRVARCR